MKRLTTFATPENGIATITNSVLMLLSKMKVSGLLELLE
jgi:hypothetical protein